MSVRPQAKDKPAAPRPARKPAADGEVDLVAEIESAFPDAASMAEFLGVTVEGERQGKNGERERHARGYAGLYVSIESGAWRSHGNNQDGGSVIALANYIRTGANEIPAGKAFVDLARVLVPEAVARRDAAFEARMAKAEARRQAEAAGWVDPMQGGIESAPPPPAPRVESPRPADDWPEAYPGDGVGMHSTNADVSRRKASRNRSTNPA
mgnify:CR=1 FL=1